MVPKLRKASANNTRHTEARPVLDPIPHMDAGMLWRRDGVFSEAAEAFQQFLFHSFGV